MFKNITKIALTGVAMATGVAVLVMNILKTFDVAAGVPLLGTGQTALAIASFQG